jgi:hypothetical protein
MWGMCPKMSHRSNIPEFALLIYEKPGVEVFFIGPCENNYKLAVSGSIRIFKLIQPLTSSEGMIKYRDFALIVRGKWG